MGATASRRHRHPVTESDGLENLCGWTRYTGSAGWMYRLIAESLLGLRLEVDRLHVAPYLPAHRDALTIH